MWLQRFNRVRETGTVECDCFERVACLHAFKALKSTVVDDKHIFKKPLTIQYKSGLNNPWKTKYMTNSNLVFSSKLSVLNWLK